VSAAARTRFWLLYTAAWLPYIGTFILAFVSTETMSISIAIRGAFANALPDALLGALALWYVDRSGKRPAPRPATFAWVALVGIPLAVLGKCSLVALDMVLSGRRPQFLPVAHLAWMGLTSFLVFAAIGSLGWSIGAARRLREEVERADRARALQTEAELRSLRAQLNPHFLFNTLHSLLALIRSDQTAAEMALEQFGDLMRYALRTQEEGRDRVRLAEEWQFVTDYLALETLRLTRRLRARTDADPGALDVMVPAFILQPLVENAVRHAIAPRPEGGDLTIEARLTDGRLRLRVDDDGPGATADAVDESRGLGVRLVRQRLEAIYGRDARFELRSTPGAGFHVLIDLPAELR